MKYSLIFITLFLTFLQKSYSQKNGKDVRKEKIFITAGFGLAGSFFVRSYEEFSPVPNAQLFEKKHFIGNAQNIAVGINLKKGYQVRIGMNFQHFTKTIKVIDTINSVLIKLDHDIHHRDYMWYGAISKNFEKGKHILIPGIGIYYLRSKQEEIEIQPSLNYFINIERNYKNSYLEEAGVFTEFAYEYKFQPKVNLGVKTQFYFTASAGTAESVTLFPYIKINF